MFSFIETRLFSRLAQDLLPDAELAKLQSFLMDNPEAGKVVPASGGVRKLRWGTRGGGKRGGLRVIYYAKSAQGLIYMLTIYAKSAIENIPAHVLRQILEEVENANGKAAKT